MISPATARGTRRGHPKGMRDETYKWHDGHARIWRVLERHGGMRGAPPVAGVLLIIYVLTRPESKVRPER